VDHHSSPEDDWHHGPTILDPERLHILRTSIAESPLILEHWFYRGGRAPRRSIFEEFDVLEEYLRTEGRPGDAFHFWRFDRLCRTDNELMHSKFPDQAGLVPRRGAY
jgi:hypothetical protein